MLLYKSYIKPSAIHGIGLYTAEPIEKGRLMWKFTPPFDVAFTDDLWKLLHPDAATYIRHYSYLCHFSKLWILCGDNARFYNHSDTPNTEQDPTNIYQDLALRDIKVDEEITCDYGKFDLHGLKTAPWV